MDRESYIRGWEDCLDTIYYMYLKKGIRDKSVYEVIDELRTSVKTNKIEKILDELGLV